MSAAFSITPRQRDAFEFIVRYIAAHRTSPSYDDIASALQVKSKSTVNGLVMSLVKRGLIRKLGNSQRSLTLVTEPASALPPHLQARLVVFCVDQGERYDDVLADAVALHLDFCEQLDVIPAAGGGES